jgi:iron complex outermembrane receptor protein
LEYKPDQNFLGYLSYAEGFKSGGFTYVTLFASDLSQYKPEHTKTWELGFKSEFWDRRLRANTALFYTDYSDLQFESLFPAGVVCPTFCSRTLNAADARIEGAEVELTAVPIEHLDLFANAAYMQNQVTHVDADALSQVTLNSKLPRTPDWTATVGGNYTWMLGNAGSITLRADYSFRSRVYFDFSNVPQAGQGNLGLVNAGISYSTPDGRWQFALNGQNLTNELYATSGTGTTVRSDGYAFVFYGPPRTITASIRYRFGD